MKLIVGLGNPGPQYRNHRHNAGFVVVDELHGRASASEWREKFVGVAARGVLAGHEVTLLKPSTFMNLSGRSVQRAVQQLGLKPHDVLVIHDDLDLAFGDVRAKLGGGHGGHNGLRDITASIGPDYARVRVGIGRPAVGAVESYVLSGFSRDEQATLGDVIARAAEAVETAVVSGVETAMNKANAKGGTKKK